ncbi:MAG: sensor histidine kinase KdpD [Rickettsiales bacterium]
MNNDESRRPSPDELLSRIKAEEHEKQQKESTRGKLKIFFGACAGVGKTYSMLSSGKTALNEGIDVVIGLVETHGRPETQKLLDGLPIIPCREIEYKGTLIKEFDIDAAIARKPQLILLDELAHTNAPNSRHPKRWHDVDELLDAGINVYTTINVQHLESLNDVVARITGVWVKETVPDIIFDKADEISLVDIPSEELLKRLSEGKVYIAPEAKKRAAQNFFKKSNLIALREMALRRTAERVDALMDVYKDQGTGAKGWSGAERILVCIGPDAISTKLVRAAKRMSSGLKSQWTVIYIENERHFRLNKEGKESVEKTLRLANRMGAKTEIVQGHSKASDDILTYARENGITKIIVGKPNKSRLLTFILGTLADEIIRGSGEIDVYVVTGDSEDRKALLFPFWKKRTPWQYYSISALVILTWTLLMLPIRGYVEPINLVMLYLIGIVGVSLRYGRMPSLLATFLSAIFFNLFFIPPYNTLKVIDEKYFITFAVLLFTGMIIGTQTSKLRIQTIAARKREKHTSILFAMSRELTANRGKVTLAQIAAQHMAEVLDSNIFLWLADEKDELQTVIAETHSDLHGADPVREESVARWTFSHKQNAGLGTNTMPSANSFYVPLVASAGVMGVIGLMPHDEDIKSYSSDKIELIEALSNIIALAIERAQSAEMVEKTTIEAESEKLRNILLSSVSHDLRTPLASITSSASALLLEGEKATNEYKMELIRVIHEEGARLAKIVTNLLDVTSLESGSVKLNKELYFIEELIGSALMRVEQKMSDHKVITDIENGLPLLHIDGLLIEQVLINLLENAAMHTEKGTTVTIAASTDKENIKISVHDNGKGIKEKDKEKIFDKFYSGTSSDGSLGLAICRGIVNAHGGEIWVDNVKENTGAVFSFTIPIKNPDTK